MVQKCLSPLTDAHYIIANPAAHSERCRCRSLLATLTNCQLRDDMSSNSLQLWENAHHGCRKLRILIRFVAEETYPWWSTLAAYDLIARGSSSAWHHSYGFRKRLCTHAWHEDQRSRGACTAGSRQKVKQLGNWSHIPAATSAS